MLSPYLASATSVSVCCSDGVSLCYEYTLCHRTCLKFSLSVGVCSRALLLANNFSGCVSFSLLSSAMWERLQNLINQYHCGVSVFLQSGYPTLSATPAQVSWREAEEASIYIHLPLLVSVICFDYLPPAFGIINKHREAAVLFDGERLPIREISWQLHFDATVLQLHAEYRGFPQYLYLDVDSQTPFQASLPNMQSGSRGCSFPELPGPDGHPLL
ncbi:hypothetical protein GGI42DRAFT_230186 [Trichoderma sp. SZMC 28013]